LWIQLRKEQPADYKSLVMRLILDEGARRSAEDRAAAAQLVVGFPHDESSAFLIRLQAICTLLVREAGPESSSGKLEAARWGPGGHAF
jgi:hypothetical protein